MIPGNTYFAAVPAFDSSQLMTLRSRRNWSGLEALRMDPNAAKLTVIFIGKNACH